MTLVKCPHCKTILGCNSNNGWWESLCVGCIEHKTNTCTVKDKDSLDTVNVICKNCLTKSSAIEVEEFWSKR